MRHDERPDQARRDAPARRVHVFQLPVLVEELDIRALREVLPQIMARAHLQRLAVLHHAFDALRVHSAGEPFAFRLVAAHHRHAHHVLGDVRVDIQHPRDFLARLRLRRVRRVPLLPQELRRA